jgi:predicted permease
MISLRAWLLRIGGLFARQRRDRDLSDEMESHLQMHIEDNLQRGMTPAEARRQALIKLGGVEQTKENYRERRGIPFLETLLQDIRFAFRMLRKSPGFTAVAVLTLALGIGANTAIFSVVDAVLLRPLPYPSPQSIALVVETVGKTEHNPVSYPNFLDWQRENKVFQNLAAYAPSEVNLSSGGNSEHVPCEVVSGGYFDLLGVHPILGGTFPPEKGDRAPSVVLLGYGLWKSRFGGNASVIGRSIQVNESESIIVGVLPRGFRGFSGHADIWAPMQTRDVLWPESARFKLLQSRDIHWHRVIGRLKSGVTLPQAQAEMSAMGAQLAEMYPEANHERGVAVLPAKQSMVGGLRTPLLVLLGAVGCVLLIACANVANLFLVRAIARRREIAIRVSLGAGRARLIRQLLTESLLVAMLGGALGVLLAFWALKILAVNLPVALPYYADIKINLAVLVFTLLTTGITGLLLGSLPSWKISRPDLAESLKEAARSSVSKRQGRAGSALVVLETAAVLLLMIGAGLLLRSFERMSQIAPGFRPDHLLTLRVHVPNRGYTAEQRALLGQRLVEKIESTPGVELAAANTADLFVWDGISRGYTIEGRTPVPTSETDTVQYHEVSPGFFKTMGISFEAGRDFTLLDGAHAPRTIIVSRSFAQRYWSHQNPIGKRLKFGPSDSSQPWMNVIGVVGDYRYHDYLLNPDDTPVMYGALAQNQNGGEISLLVRTKTDPAAMADPLRRTIKNVDPNIPVYSVATLEGRLAEQSEQPRASAELVTLFALLALALAAVGLYGVMSHAVSQQTHEIGIRMALGAQRKNVLGMILAKGLRLAGLGIGCGFLAALVLTRLMRTLLFGVAPTDAATFAVVAILLMLVALAACYIPARRAMKVDPMVALRYE